MDNPVSLTIDQIDEINKNLRRAKSLAKLVAELGDGRSEWPDIFGPVELGTIMHLIAEEVEMAQSVFETCKGDEEGDA
jgi:hypothetical protein